MLPYTKSVMNNELKKKSFWKRLNNPNYEKGMGDYALTMDSEIINALIPKSLKGKFALDYPCGMGRHTKLLIKAGYTVHCGDINEFMLQSVSKKYKCYTFTQDIFQNWHEKQMYDLVLCSRLIFHYENSEEILRKLSKVLKSEGILIFDSLNKWSVRYVIHKMLSLFGLNLLFPNENLYFTTEKDMKHKLAGTGFRVVKITSAYILPTRMYRIFPKIGFRFISAIEKRFSFIPKTMDFWCVVKG